MKKIWVVTQISKKNNTKTTRKGTRVGPLHNHTILRKLNQKDRIT